jgi:Pre-mRNA splicing Prp18-interacting factor
MPTLPDSSKAVDDPKLHNATHEFHHSSSNGADFTNLQKIAWKSERMGGNVHLQTNPTKAELDDGKCCQLCPDGNKEDISVLRRSYVVSWSLTYVVYVNNHSSVFGSWFRDGRWG